MQLVIGNKNYSSWSMRPWVLMTELGIPFLEEEAALRLHRRLGLPPGSGALQRERPGAGADGRRSGGVGQPGHGRIPARTLPRPASGRPTVCARARARCLAAEMHSGFGALRSHCPMNIEASLPDVGERIWAEQAGVRAERRCASKRCLGGRAAGAAAGRSWAALQRGRRDVRAGVHALHHLCAAAVRHRPCLLFSASRRAPACMAWMADALAEADFLDFEEPYRTQRGP